MQLLAEVHFRGAPEYGFDGSKDRYGAPRIHQMLKKSGEVIGIKRVSRLIKANQLQAKAKRKYKTTTDSNHNRWVAPNLLKQQFNVDKPNTVSTQNWLKITLSLGTFMAWAKGVFHRLPYKVFPI